MKHVLIPQVNKRNPLAKTDAVKKSKWIRKNEGEWTRKAENQMEFFLTVG